MHFLRRRAAMIQEMAGIHASSGAKRGKAPPYVSRGSRRTVLSFPAGLQAPLLKYLAETPVPQCSNVREFSRVRVV